MNNKWYWLNHLVNKSSNLFTILERVRTFLLHDNEKKKERKEKKKKDPFSVIHNDFHENIFSHYFVLA